MSRHKRPWQRLLLATLAAAASIGLAAVLTQCRSVGDNLVGARATTAAAGSCITACAMAYNDSLSVESALHVTNAQACGTDTLCLAQEEQRHEAAVNRLQAGRQDCINHCHHQGGGSGGR